MNLPHYAIVGIRPVKAVTTKEGGLIILAFNWETGKFDLRVLGFPWLWSVFQAAPSVAE
ncbi:MAG: hypothetical protein GY803_17900 [Chloroflexi bacterium]|nr:hypothetical protein [Chloroflexota bacterium]